MELARLIEAAVQVRQRAYAPYSRFFVGAALELRGQTDIFVGCNVENASYGLTICAERMAIGAAAVKYDLLEYPPHRIVVAASPVAAPCGACRQVLAEFGLELEVFVVDPSDPNGRQSYKISDLLPNSFQLIDRKRV
ncbi:MAG: cytidine deaminase [Planctomycetaceae bacterium]|nr:cytidine deaminase [Planctomycetaceae bacterium]